MVVTTDRFIVNKSIFADSLVYRDGTVPPPTSTVVVPRTTLSSSSAVSNTKLIEKSSEELIERKSIIAGSLEYRRIPKKSSQSPARTSLISCMPVPEKSTVVNAEIYCAKCSSTFWGNQCRIHTPRVMLTHNTDQCRNWRDDGSSKWYAKKNLPPMSEVVDDDSSTSSEMTQQCIVVNVMSIIFYVLYCCEYYLPEIHD